VRSPGAGTVSATTAASRVNFAGTGNVFTGPIIGAGTVAFTAGTDTFEKGAKLTIADVTQSSGTAVTVAETTFGYAGVWNQTGGTLSVSSGDKAYFTGTGNVFGGTLTGAGRVYFDGGSDTLSGATLTAPSGVFISGSTVTLTGAITLTDTLVAASPQIIVATGGASLTGGRLELTNSAANTIVGANGGATLTNNAIIFGAGDLGDGTMTLDNGVKGIIEGDDSVALTINTGSNTIVSAGEITAVTALTIDSAVDNTGVLYAVGGTLTAEGAVTGAGRAELEGAGTLILDGAFNENVTFAAGSTGTLELDDPLADTTGVITGLASTGDNAIVLLNNTYVSGTTTYAYAGSTTSGVLTIKQGGTTIATLNLAGGTDYSTTSFTLSAGPGGVGTKIVDPTTASVGGTTKVVHAATASAPHLIPPAPLSLHPFIAAMAGFGAPKAGAATLDGVHSATPSPALAMPRTQMT
jgi:hypothetical protein